MQYSAVEIVFCSLGCFISGFLIGTLVEMRICRGYQLRAIKALELIQEKSDDKNQKEDVV